MTLRKRFSQFSPIQNKHDSFSHDKVRYRLKNSIGWSEFSDITHILSARRTWLRTTSLRWRLCKISIMKIFSSYIIIMKMMKTSTSFIYTVQEVSSFRSLRKKGVLMKNIQLSSLEKPSVHASIWIQWSLQSIHRDIKPENIIVDATWSEDCAKLYSG